MTAAKPQGLSIAMSWGSRAGHSIASTIIEVAIPMTTSVDRAGRLPLVRD